MAGRNLALTSNSLNITIETILDVTITYKPLPFDGEKRKFDDLVEYRKQSASSDSAPSTGESTGMSSMNVILEADNENNTPM
jgi:hypothetical protein